jgi:hypothetical protein
MRKSYEVSLLAGCLLLSGCAVRLGGAKPEGYNAIALKAAPAAGAAEVAARITAENGDLVLLSADRDSAWFADVAAQTKLTLDGPGRTGPSSLAFLTRLKVLGDTAMVLPLDGGGRLTMQDALFEVDKNRTLDMMLVSFAEAGSVHDGVRTLLDYIATDVGGTAALLLGIDAPTQAAADSTTLLLRAAFTNVRECGDATIAAPPGGLGLQLYYGPEVRLSCESAHILAGTAAGPAGIVARVVVER